MEGGWSQSRSMEAAEVSPVYQRNTAGAAATKRTSALIDNNAASPLFLKVLLLLLLLPLLLLLLLFPLGSTQCWLELLFAPVGGGFYRKLGPVIFMTSINTPRVGS